MSQVQKQALRVTEALRYGLPPEGSIRVFTVGREHEIERLKGTLQEEERRVMLLQANYGTGKSHLLHFIREEALSNGYAVSTLIHNTQAAVNFSRMDQIFGEAIENLELPEYSGKKGPAVLFRAVWKAIENKAIQDFRRPILDSIASFGCWKPDTSIKSTAVYCGLRAWLIARTTPMKIPGLSSEVERWLSNPSLYSGTRDLYWNFINRVGTSLDLDAYNQFKGQIRNTFSFKVNDYQQAWDGLADLDFLAKLCGAKGLVLLVDEFENVVKNRNRASQKNLAILNLFRFLEGKDFPGYSYYAVPPGFLEDWKEELYSKNYLENYDDPRFDSVPIFEMSPLQTEDLLTLAKKIAKIYGLAYKWQVNQITYWDKLQKLVYQKAKSSSGDRVRNTICAVVEFLDEWRENEIKIELVS